MLPTCPDGAQLIQPTWRHCLHCGQPLTAVAGLGRILAAEAPTPADRPRPPPGRSSIRWVLISLPALGSLSLAFRTLPAVLGLAGIH
jgi:hypothetical protein